VTVILRDRTRVEGKFLTRDDRTITLDDGSVLARNEMQAFIVNPALRVNEQRRARNQADAEKREADEKARKQRRAARKRPRKNR
jgi:hypothetical protein